MVGSFGRGSLIRIGELVITALVLATRTGLRATARETESAPPFEEILKIDVHSHVFEDIPAFVDMMRRINLRIVNICVYGNKPEVLRLLERRAEALCQKYRPRFYFASTFDLTRGNEAGYSEEVKAWLDETFKAGAVMTKIWKEVGMQLKNPAGEYLMPDDPLFDPIYAHLAERRKPLLAHLADPINAWLPLAPESVHYRYYSNHPEWYVYGRKGFPSHDQILAARDHILEKHPDLIVIGAHCGSMAHHVDEIVKRFDRYPNFYIDVAARTASLARQPSEKVRDFFIKYQDRIMYGVDLPPCRYPREGTISEEERMKYTENAEQTYRHDYQYYAETGTVNFSSKDVECLALPRPVLEKFYHKNAQRLMLALAE